MCRDFVFIRFHLLAFHFNEFRTCRTQPSSICRQTVEGSIGFAQTIKTSMIDKWFGLIGDQDCNRTKGRTFIAMKPHFGYNPDCFDYERNAVRWFGLTGDQDCNRTKGTSFIAVKPHFGCNPDCFDYERNERIFS